MRKLAHVTAVSVLSVSFLSWVVLHVGPTRGEVVVHVNEPDIDLTVGTHTYLIKRIPYDPIVCELATGWHELTVTKHGRVLSRQRFEVEGGQTVVLVACDPPG